MALSDRNLSGHPIDFAPLQVLVDLAKTNLRTGIWFEIASGPPPFLKFLLQLVGRRAGKTSFQETAPSQVWLRINSLRGIGKGDGRELGERIDALPPPILARLQNGDSTLILDFSHEGRRSEHDRPFSYIESVLRNRNFPLSKTLILTQNLNDTQIPASSERCSIPVHAHYYAGQIWLNSFPEYYAGQIWLNSFPEFRDRQTPPLGFALEYNGERIYRFICLNFHLRPLRALLVARLLERRETGFISFSTKRQRRTASERELLASVRALSVPAMAEQNAEAVARLLRSNADFESDADFQNTQAAVYTLPVNQLERSDLFIVTETEMEDERLLRFTEKTLKAVISGLPFIVFGNYHTIETLRQIGFDVLDDIIDHNYDNVVDPAKRFEAAWTEVCRVLESGPDLVEKLRNRLNEAKETNSDIFLHGLPHCWFATSIKKINEFLTPG